MNNQQKHEQEWVDQALSSLEGVQRAEANPYLHTRVMQRLQAPATLWEKVGQFVARPGFALMAGLLVVGINAYVATRQTEERQVVQQQASEQLFAAEFVSNEALNHDLNHNR